MLNTRWQREGDWNSTCGRNSDQGACGVYFPVTDPLGKPVVMLDAAQNITGTGEYDPFGQVNRTFVDQETQHPKTVSSGSPVTIGSYQQSPWQGNMTVAVRARLNEYDGTTDGGCVDEGQSVTFGTPGYGWTFDSCDMGGYVFPYFPLGAGDTATVTTAVTATSWNIWGGIVDGWDYRRYSSPQPMWTPMRLPGQYHDDETDLVQNWNRFYDASEGRHWEPEPLLTNHPEFAAGAAMLGHGVPTYAYALNNPIAFSDEDGKQALPVPVVVVGVGVAMGLSVWAIWHQQFCAAHPEMCAPPAPRCDAHPKTAEPDDCRGHYNECINNPGPGGYQSPSDCLTCLFNCEGDNKGRWNWGKTDANGKRICDYRNPGYNH